MKKINLFFLLIALNIFSLSLNASTLEKNTEAILKIGQNMASIRGMLEAYSMITAKIKYKVPKEKLKKDIAEYESLISYLAKSYKKDKVIKKYLQIEKSAWAKIKPTIMSAFDTNNIDEMKKSILFIHGNIRKVLRGLEDIKAHIIKKYDIANEKELNAAIEIGASAKRLSAHYMMKMLNVNDPTIDQHWKKGVKIYSDSIAILKASKYYKNPKFKTLLDDAQRMLKYFETMYSLKKYMPVVFKKKAEHVVQESQEMLSIVLKK